MASGLSRSTSYLVELFARQLSINCDYSGSVNHGCALLSRLLLHKQQPMAPFLPPRKHFSGQLKGQLLNDRLWVLLGDVVCSV